ncbi:hypothetical protein AgCh_003313 [Apium graveolens]
MGHYSVKSGYNIIQQAKVQASTIDNSGFLRQLWDLKIPNKVKKTLWRASTYCLPTKDMLQVKRIQVNPKCPVCNLSDESVIHTLVSYNNFDFSLSFITPEDGLEQWCPSSLNNVKVNVDAALFEDPSRYNHAIIARDHSCQLIQALSKCSLGKASPELAEGRDVDECRQLLENLRNQNAVLHFVKRSANIVAHYIARSAGNSLYAVVWTTGGVI